MSIVWYVGLFLECCILYFFLFRLMQRERLLYRVIRQTLKAAEKSAKQRAVESRKSKLLLQSRRGLLYELEKRLAYSGITTRYPVVTPEIWILANLMLSVLCYFLFLFLFHSWWKILLSLLIMQGGLILVLNLFISRNYNKTEGELLKFLDFLGNYSITTGELTSVLYQISPYLEEPLRSTLRECYYEAGTWRDVSMALFSLEDKLQHPKMKEIIRNLEVTMRYSADYRILVEQSRRSVREFLRLRGERKGMMREAYINLLLLLGMAVLILRMLEGLLGIALEEVLFHSAIGKIGVALMGILLLSFYGRIRKLAG